MQNHQRSGSKILPWVFLVLEVTAMWLTLHITNMLFNPTVHDIITIVALTYFLFGAVGRFLAKITREKDVR